LTAALHFQLVSRVKGCADDNFIYIYAGGAYIHPLVFRTPLGQNPDIAEYQVWQTEDGAKMGVLTTEPSTLHYFASTLRVDVASLRQELVDGLAKSGLLDAQISIAQFDRLERHKETGKLKRFIPFAP
jgi:phenylacetate-CoA ligase